MNSAHAGIVGSQKPIKPELAAIRLAAGLKTSRINLKEAGLVSMQHGKQFAAVLAHQWVITQYVEQ